MNPITIGTDTYTSVAAAWRERSPAGLTLAAVRWRLRQGWPTDQAVLLAPVPPTRRRRFRYWRERGRSV